MEKRIKELLDNWQKRNIQGFYFQDRQEAVNAILKLIPKGASVGYSGSMTLSEIGLFRQLEGAGHKIFDPYRPGLSKEESLEIRREATQADVYLASANAVSRRGELVFFSAYGNRTAGIAYARRAIIVCGINKLVDNLTEALTRSRQYAAPLNCRRLNWQSACFSDGICRESVCLAPEYNRMCCQVLTIEAETQPGRLTVVLIGEKLGY